MLNWIVRNRTVWVDLQNVFTNHIFSLYVKTGFGNKLLIMVDVPENLKKYILETSHS